MSTARTIHSLEDEVASLKKDNADLASDSTKKDTKIEDLTRQINEMAGYDSMRDDAFADLQSQIDDLKVKLDTKDIDLKDSKNLFENQVKMLEDRVKASQSDLRKVEGEASRYSSEAQELRTRLQDAVDERDQYGGELQQNKHEFLELKSRIDHLTVENAKVIEEREAATQSAGWRERTLEDELRDEVDDRGDFSPESREVETFGIGYSTIMTTETAPVAGVDHGHDESPTTTGDTSDSLQLRRTQFPEQSRSLFKLSKATVDKTGSHEMLGDSPVSFVEKGHSSRIRHTRLSKRNNYVTNVVKKVYNFTSNPIQAIETTIQAGDKDVRPFWILGFSIICLVVIVVLGQYLISRSNALSRAPGNCMPSRYQYNNYGAYNNGRKLLGVVPIGYHHGSNPLHAALLVIERYLAIPNQRMVI